MCIPGTFRVPQDCLWISRSVTIRDLKILDQITYRLCGFNSTKLLSALNIQNE
ncbi:hypothetical protein LIPSTDRAFT_72502 [Lipomyces starkeyi NRRL Y-11557]|uniref:Uncharacterized protein n=1 Tax=Lipomyces starkeyi NRRL Y-11557 TaxID=675824 RepID=A0A1E3Q2C2_LIPST|nr:hypothetical protein LIPSTDRAFT_72502 [Lipomyces starkeyi NRRL Y-11557]